MFRLLALTLLWLSFAVPLHAEEGEGKPAASAAAKEPAKSEGDTKQKKESDVTGGRFAGDPVYVHIAPMILPVITEAGVEQLVTIQLDIEVKDFDVADTIHAQMPRVIDALMRGLYGSLGQGSVRHGKMVDVQKVKARATAALGEVITGDGITNVLIQGVSQRML